MANNLTVETGREPWNKRKEFDLNNVLEKSITYVERFFDNPEYSDKDKAEVGSRFLIKKIAQQIEHKVSHIISMDEGIAQKLMETIMRDRDTRVIDVTPDSVTSSDDSAKTE